MASVIYPVDFKAKNGFPYKGNQVKKEIVLQKNNLKALYECGRIIAKRNILDNTEAKR